MLKDALHAAWVVLTGKKVSLEIFTERVEKCNSCAMVRTDQTGTNFCGICGCTVAKENSLLNLAAYEEDLPKHGCKHPFRGLIPESGWKR